LTKAATIVPNQEDHRELSAAGTPEYPGDDCCLLFDKQNWEGDQSLKICRDNNIATQLFNLSDYDFDKKVSSWACGKNVAYDFCSNVRFSEVIGGILVAWNEQRCDREYGNKGAGNAKSINIEQSDSGVSTVYLSKYDPSEQPATLLFSGKGCKDRFGRFYAPSEKGISNDYREHVTYYNNGSAVDSNLKWNVQAGSI